MSTVARDPEVRRHVESRTKQTADRHHQHTKSANGSVLVSHCMHQARGVFSIRDWCDCHVACDDRSRTAASLQWRARCAIPVGGFGTAGAVQCQNPCAPHSHGRAGEALARIHNERVALCESCRSRRGKHVARQPLRHAAQPVRRTHLHLPPTRHLTTTRSM